MRTWVLAIALPVCLPATDWPRFGGPSADFQSSTTLRWPEGGPKKLWERPLGEGYSGIVISGPALYSMYRRDGQEVVVSLEAETGKTLWEFPYDAPLPKDFDTQNTTGPRATPLVEGERLFTAGAGGKLHCLDRKSGKRIWSRDVVADFHGAIRVNGYAASPVAWHDLLIVFPNAPGAAIAALRQSDGEVVWKRHSFTVSYATPILARVGGREQLIAQFSDEVTGIDPATGDLLWSHPHTNSEKVNVAMPVWGSDGLLFVSSGYDGSSKGLRLAGGKVEEVWSQRLIRLHHTNAVRIGDVVYGASGDLGPCPLAAADVKTGRILWRDRTFPKVSLIAAGAQLLILDEDGNLALATPSEKGLAVHGRMAVLNSNAWTAPALDGKRVYLRDRHKVVAVSLE